MKNSLKPSLALLLVLTFIMLPVLTFTLASCADGGSGDVTTIGDVTTAEPPVTDPSDDRASVKDDLPDGLKFTGETLTVFYRKGQENYDVLGTDSLGDLVTDEVWRRNRSVEDRLGITIEGISTVSGSLADVRKEMQTYLSSGTYTYDLIVTTGNSIIQMEVNTLLRDVSDLDYVDLEKPWWWSYANNELSVDGKSINFLIGDSLLSNYLKTGVVYFNKKDYVDSGFGKSDDLYGVVTRGEFTLEKFAQLSADAYRDVTGDGKSDDDHFGFVRSATLQENDIHFFIGCDVDLFTRDNDGITIDMNNDRVISVVDAMYDLYSLNRGSYVYTKVGVDALDKPFAEGKMLFYPGRLTAVIGDALRSMTDDYGILPYPKFDAEQKDYISLVHSSSCVWALPASVPNERLGMIGASLEALAGESYRKVTDIFLEVALKTKYSNDVPSGQVIDLVIAGATKSFIFEYSPQTNNIIQVPLRAFTAASAGTFSSSYNSALGAAQGKLDAFFAVCTD